MLIVLVVFIVAPAQVIVNGIVPGAVPAALIVVAAEGAIANAAVTVRVVHVEFVPVRGDEVGRRRTEIDAGQHVLEAGALVKAVAEDLVAANPLRVPVLVAPFAHHVRP